MNAIPIPTFATVARGHCGRCDRCGWPFAVDAAHGCRPGDCSQRPTPPLRTACGGCGLPFDGSPPEPEPEIVRLRRDNAALHEWKRAAIAVLGDVFRDRERAQVLVHAGLELREHGAGERPTLPDLAAIGLADDDEPARGDVIIVEPRAPSEDLGGDGDGC